jgi:hypothetical protein
LSLRGKARLFLIATDRSETRTEAIFFHLTRPSRTECSSPLSSVYYNPLSTSSSIPL